jgi:tetratricopeptide (TPR) repeat protein
LDSLSVDINIRKLKGGWPFKPDTVVNNFIVNYKPHGMVDSIAYQAVRYSDITAESAHRYLAKVYIAQDSPQKAIQEYLANIRIEPYKLDNYIDAGNLLFQTGEHEKALKIFLDALRINRDIYILSKLGEIYTATKDYRKAISYLEETVKTDPEFNKQKVLGFLYDAYEQTGETTKANKILSENKDLLTQRKPADNKNEVILRVPEEISDLIKEAYKNLKSGNTNKGLELLNKANKIQETGLANRIIGEILLQKKDVKSLEYFKKAYRDYGTDAKFLNTLCYAFIYFKEFESAKKVLIELKQLSPNNPNIPRYEKSISMRYNQL